MPHCNTYSLSIFISQPELDDCNYLDFLYSCTHEQLGQPLQQGGFFFLFSFFASDKTRPLTLIVIVEFCIYTSDQNRKENSIIG